MNTKYEKELNRICLHIHVPEIYEEDYQMPMLRANKIPGILEVNGCGIDGESRYTYEITGLVSMAVLFENKQVQINSSSGEILNVSMELPENVTGIVADSAFSSPYDIIKKRIRTTYHCKGTLLTIAIGIWSRLLAHYSLKELSVPEVMKNNTIPVLLVHGTADSNVPVEMTVKVAENCRASKKVLLVEGAEHGTGYLVDNEAYKNALREFCS